MSGRLHRTLYRLFAGVLFAVVIIGVWAYGAGTYAAVIFGVCAFVAGAFALFLVGLISVEKRRGRRPPKLFGSYLSIQTDRLPTRQALVEMLLPAVAMASAFFALSLVFSVVVP